MNDQTETTRLWLIKADRDLKIGRDEFITDSPATDAICFHMQQCTGFDFQESGKERKA